MLALCLFMVLVRGLGALIIFVSVRRFYRHFARKEYVLTIEAAILTFVGGYSFSYQPLRAAGIALGATGARMLYRTIRGGLAFAKTFFPTRQ